MEALRSVIKWANSHRILSLVLAVFIGIITIYVPNQFAKMNGSLSNPLEKGTIVESVYGIGTVMATRSYQIKFGVTSTINQIYVKEGDAVKKGARLMNIDGSIYSAPFSGTITSLPYKAHENIFAQMPLLTLVDLNDRYVLISLEQQGALRVKPGQKAKLSFDTIREQNYDGVVESIYSFENNFLARINVSSLPPIILPGMTADVAITLTQKSNALLAPVAALEEGKYYWTKNGKWFPKRVEVKIGIVDKAMVEIVSGDLNVGDRVLIRKQANP